MRAQPLKLTDIGQMLAKSGYERQSSGQEDPIKASLNHLSPPTV